MIRLPNKPLIMSVTCMSYEMMCMTYTEEKTDNFVSGVINISYFSGFFNCLKGAM